MWVMTRFAIIFYITIIWTTSIAVMLFVLHVLDLRTVNELLGLIYNDSHVGILVFGIALGIIMISFLLENLIYGQRRRERNIVFDNAQGPVAVSLSALEDLIKRLCLQMEEIKEVRPTVLAIRKGLDVDIKLVLRSEVNIPDLTSRMQDLVRKRIEETISMEGKVFIRIHVTKIALDDIKTRRSNVIEQPQVPFHGYRA